MNTLKEERSSTRNPNQGLTRGGVVLLQTLFIGIFLIIELAFGHGVGIFTGLAICVALFVALRFGRSGTSYLAVVTPPIAFAGISLLIIAFNDTFHISRIGLDFVAALASAAPYLLVSAAYGWFTYFRGVRQKSS